MAHNQRWQDWMNLLLGLYLFASPSLFGAASTVPTAARTEYIFGAIIILVSLWALRQPLAWEEWTNLAVAVLLIMSPLILGFSTDTVPMWNALLTGMFVGVDAMWAIP